ncbi:MAG: restriction endonuclease subunit S [Adhaeribacter sp.]
MLLLEQFHNLTLNPANAARLKELVLQLAVQGKLTEAWRKENPDVEPAAELLRKIEAEKEELVRGKKIKKEKSLEPMSEDEVPYEVPESWMWCKLGEVGYTNIGLTYSPKDIANVGIPVLRSSNIQNGKIDLNDLVRVDKKVDSSNLVKKGDLLICARNGSKKLVGKCALIKELKEETAFGAFMAIFRSEYNNYIKYFIESPIYRQSLEGVTTTTINQITQGNLKNTLLPLPPLAEQEAIVARLEELFKNIEALQDKTAQRIEQKKQLGTAALQNLNTATPEELPQNWQFLKDNFGTLFSEAANVKKLRETILQLAVQGKLTQAWRHQNPNTEPASELLKHIQEEKERLVKEKKIKKEQPLESVDENEVPYELPQSWSWCRLGELASSFNNGLYKPANFYTNKGIISLRMYNIQEGDIRFSDLRRVELIEEEYATYALEENDILLNRVNSAELIGKAGLIPKYNEKLVYESMNIRIRLIFKNKIAGYINLVLRTSFARDYMRANAKHAIGQSSVNQTTVSNLLISLPPISEQEAIVTKVDELMQLCDALEKQIEQSKQETESLMQAVVQETLQAKAEIAI